MKHLDWQREEFERLHMAVADLPRDDVPVGRQYVTDDGLIHRTCPLCGQVIDDVPIEVEVEDDAGRPGGFTTVYSTDNYRAHFLADHV